MRVGMSIARAPLEEGEPLPPDCDRSSSASQALEALYRNHGAGLRRFVAGYGRAEDAEDVVQQVFVRVAGRSDHDEITSPVHYLRQAARNLIRDTARAATRSRAELHVAIEDVVVADADPVALLEARDRLARIEQAVLRLKPLTRQIFLACRVDGFSYAEIAQQTGLSVRGVEKQMSRALKQLEKHLSRDG